MTADIRTAAQREAESLYPYMPAELELHAINRSRRLRQKAFSKGAVWGAARVTPTRQQLTSVIAVELAEGDPQSAAEAVLALMQELAEGEVR